jgi:LSD1 subclass zinc finger protein
LIGWKPVSPQNEAPVQLICPSCRSGLEVPDGTTAHVRCPACKSVFPAEDGLAAAVPEPVPAPPPPPKPVEKPKPKPAPKPQPDENKNRDFDTDEPTKKRPKRKRRVSRIFTPEEKRSLQAGFSRGYFGARCIQIALFFYLPAVLLVPVHQILAEITKSEMGYVLVIAGILGMINWILGTVGLVLCLSGPPSPGHYRYAVGGLVASLVHGVLLLAVVMKTHGNTDFRGLDRETMRWAQIATQYESLSFYLSYVAYPDEIPVKRSDTILGFLTGVAEMVRLIFQLLTLGCLAQAAGDRELAEDLTRMAGRITIIPGLMALGMLVYKIVVVETGATGGFMMYFLNYIYRGITMAVAAILGMTVRAVGDVADACDAPFQTDIDSGGSGTSSAYYG